MTKDSRHSLGVLEILDRFLARERLRITLESR